MLYNFVVNLLVGGYSPALAFIPLVVSGILVFVFVAVILNFFFSSISQFLFKS